MMDKLTKIYNTSVKYSIEFGHKTEIWSYVAYIGHNKSSILIDDWEHVPYNLRGSIWKNIKVFILIYMI